MPLRTGIAPGLTQVPISSLVTHVFSGGSSSVIDALLTDQIDVGIVSTESVFFYSDVCIVGTYIATPRTWCLLSQSESVKTFGITHARSASHSIGAIILHGHEGKTDVTFVSYANQKLVEHAIQEGACDAAVWEQFSFHKPFLTAARERNLLCRDYTTKWPGLVFVCKKGAFDPVEVGALIKRAQYEAWFFSTKLAKSKDLLEKQDLCGFSQRDFTEFLLTTLFSCLPTTSREGLENCFAEISKVPCKEVFGVEPQSVDNVIAPSCQVVLDNSRLAELSHWPSWPAIGKAIMSVKKEQAANESTLNKITEGSCAGTMPTTAGIDVGSTEDALSTMETLEEKEIFPSFPSESNSFIEHCFHFSYSRRHSKTPEMLEYEDGINQGIRSVCYSCKAPYSGDFRKTSDVAECEDLMEQSAHAMYHCGKSLATNDFHHAPELIECGDHMERSAHSVYHRNKSLATDDFHHAPELIECEDLMELSAHSVYHRDKSLATDDFHHAPELIECEDLMELSAHSVYHRDKSLPTDDFHHAPELIECEDLMERSAHSVYHRDKSLATDDFHHAPELVECEDLMERSAHSVYHRDKSLATDDFHHAPELIESEDLMERSVHSIYHRRKTIPMDDFHDAPDIIEREDLMERCTQSMFAKRKRKQSDSFHEELSVVGGTPVYHGGNTFTPNDFHDVLGLASAEQCTIPPPDNALEHCLHSRYTARKKNRTEDSHGLVDSRAVECDDLPWRCGHSVYRPN